ncbi:HAD family hydrolase [Paenibacillus sp. GCM10012306]|uniref:HAD family hydrolase n=1 Tax=Paenibacillus sp. GCM10012306 TaxID=3317342 RepID=UPI00360B5064
MKSIKVISLDMFQTLVNLDRRTMSMWNAILGDDCSEDQANSYQARLLEHYYTIAVQMRGDGQFLLTKEIYRRCFTRLFSTYNIRFEPEQALDILVREHSQAELYEETEDFIRYILGKYDVCIVSDTDEDMLPAFYTRYPIRLFASETYKSYKNDHSNTLFQQVIAHYNVRPAEIIHIGDTASDVLGAKRAGIRACWLNRLSVPWTLDNHNDPDFIIQNLNDARPFL